MHILKKDVLAFEDQNKQANETRKHVQRKPADSATEPQVQLMLQKINDLDSLVTLKDKFMEQKLAIEAKIQEANDKLEQTENTAPKLANEVKRGKDELKVKD